jgi:hypothetical protein
MKLSLRKSGSMNETAGQEEAPVAPAPEGAAPEEAAAPAPAAVPSASEAPRSAGKRKGGGNWTAFAVLAIVGTVCYLAVVAMQVLEYTWYGQPPSVWPIK